MALYNKIYVVICAFAALVVTSSISHAATLDFTELNPLGNLAGPSLTLSNATIETIGAGFLTFGSEGGIATSGLNNKGSICAYDGLRCLNSMTILFNEKINNLSIRFEGFDTGDEVIVSGFDGTTLKNFIFVTNQTLVDFSSFGSIDKLIFNNDSDTDGGNGLLYRDFNFDVVQAGPVIATPLPAALPLFGAALAGLGITGWRRRKKI